jgi:hypothetical protein
MLRSLFVMERCFSIEAKSFCFSAKEGSPVLRLEERRKGFAGFIFARFSCLSWLVDTVEVASKVKDDIAKSYREGDKVFMVYGGANKAGRFLEVSIFVEGGRKGGLWLLEGNFGWGWRRFAGELRLLLASPEGKSGFETESLPPSRLQCKQSKIGGIDAPTGGSQGRSFVEVLLSKPNLELDLPKGRSPPCLNFLQEMTRPEMGNSGFVQHNVVDCFDLEEPSTMAAVSTKKKMGFSVKQWVKHFLRFFQSKLGWVFTGFLEGFLM